MTKLPDYVSFAISNYREAWQDISEECGLSLARSSLESAIQQYAHEPYDPKSQVCCVKGCSDGAVWGCPPLCEHHTELLEPKLIEENPETVLKPRDVPESEFPIG